MKIRSKINIASALLICIIIAVYYLLQVYEHARIRDNNISTRIISIQKAFNQLVEHDIRTLATGLQVIIQDPGLREKFLSNDREALYAYAEPLFKNLKEKFGITHFYFILPDGECFLRVHNKQLYGDMVNRHTLLRSRKTQGLAAGIELGMTAFALRTVMPYYHEGRLIGYVELGEEIDHFLQILKGQTGEEYALMGHKGKLDREEWKSIKKVAGQRDNWDDMPKHLLVAQTAHGRPLEKCISEDSIEAVERGKDNLLKFKDEAGSYICTGFEIKDAAGENVGALVLPLNTTLFTRSLENITKNSILYSLIVLLVSTMGIIIFVASITKPLARLENAAKMMADGNFKTVEDIKSNDEVGSLAKTFNQMALALETTISSLQQEITLRKQAEEEIREKRQQLSTLNRKFTEMEETERRQLVQELHDRIGQNLTAISLNLNILKNHLGSAPDSLLGRIDDTITLLGQMTDETRDIMARLRPPVLDDFGLVAAVKWYAERFSDRSEITVEFTGNEFSPRLSPDKEIILFRIAQEAFSNIARHAGASHVDVNFDEADGKARMTIHDNGVGFDIATIKQPDQVKGWGVLSMKERAKMAGGSFSIETGAEQGTTLIVELPK